MGTYFAQINSEGTVLDVRSVSREFLEAHPDLYPGTWVETFFIEDNNPKKRPAQIGGSYLSDKNIFLNRKPYSSWIYDDSLQDWKAPVPSPTLKYRTKINISEEEWYYEDLAEDGIYDPVWMWDEATLQWKPYGDRI